MAETQKPGHFIPRLRPDGTPVNVYRGLLPVREISTDNKLLTNYLVKNGVDPVQAIKMGTFPPNSPKAPPPFPPFPPFLPPPSPPPLPPFAPKPPGRPPAFPNNPNSPPFPNIVVARLAAYLPTLLPPPIEDMALGYGARLALETNKRLALEQAQLQGQPQGQPQLQQG
eukprot:CAMPEP_0196592192 /NCGR_PEP_ID=MMETSP1081-20130531/72019_1 /TAXON_ID=36882 /ORGANISM="Pyramimonas amylifera, Strain CCMP720" /LENGTH=168 /DNA_ID=CAMNT_0041915801 /DNA_START=78 /DNA_END=584 /DNA_ORIENTATION=-